MFFFGETNESVKDLALHATKLLMSKLTGYGRVLSLFSAKTFLNNFYFY